MRLAPLALLLVVSLFAQRYDDSITVNVVDVPVYVERFGVPIQGLTRDDFELFVDGAPQPIEYFDVLEERGERPAAAAPTSAPVELKRRRLVVLLFDVGSSPRALQRSRVEAVQFVQRSRPGDTYAVAMIGRSGIRFLVPFTNDRVAVQRAIGTLTPSAAADPFRVATLDGERAFWQETVGGSEEGAGTLFDAMGGEPRGGFESSRSAAAARDLYRMAARAEQEERFIVDGRFMTDLSGLADRLKSLEGVKHVVLLSERPGIQNASRYFNAAMRLHERYRAAGVILDGVDIRQPWAPGATAAQSGAGIGGRPDLFPSRFLHNLALETGGAVVSSLRHLEERNRITYVLGFRSSRARKGMSSVRVRVKDAPLFTDVRYRRSFTVGAAEEGDDALFLADTLLNDIPQRGMTVDLAVEGKWVAARIPGAEMLAHPSDEPLPLDVFFYVFDAKGDAVAWSHVQVRVDLAAGRPFLEKHPYTIRQEFRLDPGRYVAKALVRIAGTNMTGFRRTDFEVTAP